MNRYLSLFEKTNINKLNQLVLNKTELDIIYLIGEIQTWYEGQIGMRQRVGEINIKKVKNTFNLIQSVTQQNIPKYAYRMANINVDKIKYKEDIFKIKKAILGTKPILSFTHSELFAEKFYKMIYKDLNRRKDKRFAYVIVKVNVTSDNYLGSTNLFVEFLNELINLNKLSKRVQKYAIQIYKMLNNKFYSQQEEIILYNPEMIYNIEVIKILHSNLED